MIKDQSVKKASKFDIELLDRILAILMDLELTTDTRFLCGLVLSSYEFEHSEQIKSFLPKFLSKMTAAQMIIEGYSSFICHSQTEDFIMKMLNTERTPDFLKQFLIPTSEKVFVITFINKY